MLTLPLTAVVLFAVQVTGDIIAWSGNACNGAQGANVPCNGACIDFTGRHSFEVVSSSGHSVTLFENGGCTGEAFNFGFENPFVCIAVDTGTPIGSFVCF